MIMPAIAAGRSDRVLLEPDRAVMEYSARRSYAYAIGEELALKRTISADAYLFLYKELVRLCKDRTYCWAGVDWLAQRLETSQGTVKRWLTQLVAAGLIQRKTRPGGDTALTSVCALIAYDQPGGYNAAQVEQSESDSQVAPFPSISPEGTQPAEALFFALPKRIMNESSDGSHMIRHTVKKHNPNHGLIGSGSGTIKAESPAQPAAYPQDHPVVLRLIEAGVADPGVLQELHTKPVAEIDAVCCYVAAQPNCYNPPGLVVSLVRSGIGAALLRKSCIPAERQQSGRNRQAGRQTISESNTPSPMMTTVQREEERGGEYTNLWAVAQTSLAKYIPAAEFAAWIQEARLIAYRDGQAVIAVPNVFARDKIDITYRSDIVDVLQTITGTGIVVDIVIDDTVR